MPDLIKRDTFRANEIPIAELLSRYEYNPNTGNIMKVTSKGLKSIGYLDSKGYYSVTHKGISLKMHRMAYALYYHRWPDNELDHINRNTLDNRIVNLRDADRFVNNQNRIFHKKWSIERKNEIFNGLLKGENPSNFEDLNKYFPYSFLA